ncbi:bleomycin resistance protein [Celeribacter sp.]|uniref:bleomycin resistance protein n=1 Tax=Celeribacter sp. TaxID=1890673 RepID=UPI003A8F85F6
MSRAPRPALIPEFAVSDWRDSRDFYCDLLGFTIDYAREEDGFAMLALGHARLMIDQIGAGRTFDDGHLPDRYPFGRGVNLQIEVPNVHLILDQLAQADHPLLLPLEETWYRKGAVELGQRQFVVADPDGYLLRLFEPLGERPATC